MLRALLPALLKWTQNGIKENEASWSDGRWLSGVGIEKVQGAPFFLLGTGKRNTHENH